MTSSNAERAREQGQLILQYARLRASHNALLAAAKISLPELNSLNRAFKAFHNSTLGPADKIIPVLQAAIAKAEELANQGRGE
jgi:hypothetical protein